MGGEYVYGQVAQRDAPGGTVELQWTCVNRRAQDHPDSWCSLVTQELGVGGTAGDFFATPPSWIVVNAVLVSVAKRWLDLMIIDVNCAFLYNEVKRKEHVEDPQWLYSVLEANLKNNMQEHGTSQARVIILLWRRTEQIWLCPPGYSPTGMRTPLMARNYVSRGLFGISHSLPE